MFATSLGILALVYTAVINGVVAVLLPVFILLVANNQGIMQGHTNGNLSNIGGIATTLRRGAAALAAVIVFFHH